MLGVAPKNIYQFCLKDWSEVESALTELAQSKDKLAEQGVANLDKFYSYIYPLYDIVTAGANNPKWLTEQGILKFLSVDLVKNFLSNPKNVELRAALSVEFAMIYTGIGRQTTVEPYDLDELKKILDGTLEYYNDFVFAHTMFDLVAKPGDKERIEVLAQMLKAEGGVEFLNATDWEVMFLESLMIRALWANLDVLDEAFQELLIKNYFYIGIVIGVPMRSLAVNFSFTGTVEGAETKKNLMMASLLDSRESIPVNLQNDEWKNMSEILKNYGAQLNGEKSSSFAQEEFIKNFYVGQNGREIWRGWLRELLVIMNNLSGF